MRTRVLTALASTLLAVAVLIGAFLVLNRPQLVTVDAGFPAVFPDDAFSHDTLAALLRKYVDADGMIDFARWHASASDRRQLESYLAAVSAFSPLATPERFPLRADALAYWMYGYNAYVIKSVLDHWPLASVTDVKAPLEAVTGLGFFYRQRFLFGGTPYSLYAVENEVIRQSFQDARVHFVLYCASASCPVLRPELPSGPELEALLEQATATFIGDPRNVSVDHSARTVSVSAIFRLYRSDFMRDLARRGIPGDRGVIDYIASVAPAALRADLQRAADYETVFMDYDWSLATQ